MPTFPPSPIPPWHRGVTNPTKETITGAGALSLAAGISILSQTEGGPYALTLADPTGCEDVLYKQIYVLAANETSTSTFVLSGNIVGFDTITFNNVGYSANLAWVGGGWHIVGGNALAA
jgi:hypothetical protein